MFGGELDAVVDTNDSPLTFHFDCLTDQVTRDRVAVGIHRDQIVRGYQSRQAYVGEKAGMPLRTNQMLPLPCKSIDGTPVRRAMDADIRDTGGPGTQRFLEIHNVDEHAPG